MRFVADREDVRARARSERRSLEDAARAARHEFFERARRQFDADVVALGHTRDDQAETFLLQAAARRRPARPGSHVSAARHDRPARSRLSPRRITGVSRTSGGMTYVEDETNARRDHPAQSRPGGAPAAAGGSVQPGHRRRPGRRGGAGARDVGLAGIGRLRVRKRGRESFSRREGRESFPTPFAGNDSRPLFRARRCTVERRAAAASTSCALAGDEPGRRAAGPCRSSMSKPRSSCWTRTAAPSTRRDIAWNVLARGSS